MASNIRAGVIGAGTISGAHLPVLSALNGVEIACICDIRPERAQAAAEKYGCAWTTGWQELIAREDVDSVHILTPHYLHARMAIACLEAGKHALTEKPMASELADARRMIAVSRAYPQLKLGVIFQNRYNPATRALKAIVDSGEQGAFLGARAEVTWRREAPYYRESGWRGAWATEGGGALINQAIHTLDLLSYLGGPIARVKGHVDTIGLQGVIEVEDNACAVIEYAGGQRGVLHVSTNYVMDAPILLEIALEKATYQILGDKLMRVDQGVPIQVEGGIAPTVQGKAYWGGGHAAQIADFYDCVRENKPLAIDASEGYPALNLVKAVYASSARNEWVSLNTL
ncbi:MAG TPA: Gfo/Idh/MocA family oxidoreductase [Candidatus Alectryocaccomicrobium excrementavium]|uniref:Gfo/Idh/MocA family oxidoreductase n=1 Tax=Candidatus Alectryocaccomicrobium excrementavium TaxID=2840668 RepID=A0A9D1G1U4_9FIRM|nr:Gfo/Idh/MocA family oxidoreductase [Candidatus Alectryocaccomicrobium excrementavium]